MKMRLNTVCSGGDVNQHFMAVVTYYGEEVKGSGPLTVHPFAVVEEQGVPYLVSSDLAAERVKIFCHTVGLSCEGFEDQLMAVRLVFQIIVPSQLTEATVN